VAGDAMSQEAHDRGEKRKIARAAGWTLKAALARKLVENLNANEQKNLLRVICALLGLVDSDGKILGGEE